MNPRSITVYKYLQEFNVGPFQVKQPLPSTQLKDVDPFLLLHHAGPSYHKPGEIKARLSPHPHRGFEPVTFIFSGEIHHKDSTGSEGFLKGGDVQWMTSGSGIIHSEGPSEEFARHGGTMELIQLWINIPRAYKMSKPKYQDIKKEHIPSIEKDGFTFKIVAGEFENKIGPASTFSPILAMMVEFHKDAETSIQVPPNFNALFYLLDGTVNSNGTKVDKLNLAVADHVGQIVHIKATEAGKLLFLAGEPLNETVVSHGPFVMNYPSEIKQAILDYQTGKMGVLEY